MKALRLLVIVLILVHGHEIEPVLLLRVWSEEFHFPVAKCPEEPLIPDIAHPVQCKLCVTFLEQDWFDCDVVRLGGSAVIVHKS